MNLKRFCVAALSTAAVCAGGACDLGDPSTGPSVDEVASEPLGQVAAPLQTVQPFSVVIASDPQFWWSRYNFTGDFDDCTSEADPLSDEEEKELGYSTNRNQVDAINALTAMAPLPGFSTRPSQVIVNGDLTDFSRGDELEAYEEGYPDSIAMPIFVGLGNHDYGADVHNDCRASDERILDPHAVDEGANFCGNAARRWLEDWAVSYQDKLETFDPGSLAYSWVKNGIRFIQLHNYPAYEEPDFHISKSIDWLHDQLADAVAQGQRVVLNMHDFGNKLDYEHVSEDQALIDALKGFEYNVVAIFSGHIHEEAGLKGEVVVNSVSIPWFRSGSATWNYFLVAEFTATGLRVVVIDSQTGDPEPIEADATIPNPYAEQCESVASKVTGPTDRAYVTNPCLPGQQPLGVAATCGAVQTHRVVHGLASGGAEARDRFGAATATGDFDHDGKLDLAVGVPEEDVDGEDDAGAVNIVYGSGSGLSSKGRQMFDQSTSGVPGDVEADDRFGYALAAGDFNGDHYDDLAIGVPGEDVSGYDDAGAVIVLYGSANGLTATGASLWHQNTDFVEGGLEKGDHFGWSLAAGDVVGDWRDDLVIGAPDEDLPGGNDGGAIHVFRGTSYGLSAVGDPGLDQDSPNVAGSVEPADRFGWSLAIGDFNNDGKEDVAVGVPHEDLDGGDDAGTVHVFRGSTGGLVTNGDPGFNQDSPNVAGSAEPGDHFGWSLAAGDFNKDGYSDLAIGVPHEDIGSADDAGTVHMFRGNVFSLSAQNDPGFNQDSPNVAGQVEGDDQFGWALAAGDFDMDGFADLAIGTPNEDVGDQDDAGMIHIFHGVPSGLLASGDPGITQSSTDVEGTAQGDDLFGSSLAAGDFNGDGRIDLAIGAPGEDLGLGDGDDDGAVNVLYGSASDRLTVVRDQIWTQDW